MFLTITLTKMLIIKIIMRLVDKVTISYSSTPLITVILYYWRGSYSDQHAAVHVLILASLLVFAKAVHPRFTSKLQAPQQLVFIQVNRRHSRAQPACYVSAV